MALARQVGLSVRALRRRRGLTQAMLAERIDRSEVALRAIERGTSAPSFQTLERLAVALAVPSWMLFQSCGEPCEAGVKRSRNLTALCALARGLSDEDLELAIDILHALSKRRTTNA